MTKSLTKSCKVILVRDDFRAGEQTLKKKPNPKKKSSKKPQNHLIRVYKFEVGQQVFAKMRGFASWPAKVFYLQIAMKEFLFNCFDYLRIFRLRKLKRTR